MMSHLTLFFHLLYLLTLRCVSLLVPARQRAEWWQEWRAELWHVRQVCIPARGFSWAAEREVTAFCIGAFQDASCLRKDSSQSSRQSPAPRPATVRSATRCLAFLAAFAMISYGIALTLPGVASILHFTGYRDTHNLMLIRDAHYAEDSIPTISVEQYQVWRRKRQELFNEFAFYQVAKPQTISLAGQPQTTGAIAVASSNLLELLGVPVHFASELHSSLPQLILSNQSWKRDFGGDTHIFGRVVQVNTHTAVVAGIVPDGAWKLPGKVNAWLLTPDVNSFSPHLGFVVGHLKTAHIGWGEAWHMSAPRPDGFKDDFFCVALTERTRGPGNIFLFAVILACLALPATTSIPLGEYRIGSPNISWVTRIRRWLFLVCKFALFLPIVYFVSLDLAYLRTTIDPISSEYIQLISSFSICLFGLRWILRDQRQRCPVCLGKLTHPARVGQPSRSFLAWNGTELICVVGHGLLHVPEMPTSWFSQQRWLCLDSSWEVLFAESGLASTGYF